MGKTRKWLAQSAVLWPGPALVSSSKDDLMQMVASRRGGPIALVDLRPISAPFYHAGSTTSHGGIAAQVSNRRMGIT